MPDRADRTATARALRSTRRFWNQPGKASATLGLPNWVVSCDLPASVSSAVIVRWRRSNSWVMSLS